MPGADKENQDQQNADKAGTQDQDQNKGQEGGGQDKGGEKKFSQEDVNKLLSKTRSEEKSKFEKQLNEKLEADKRQQELEGMGELDRVKAEMADLAKKHDDAMNTIKFNERKDAISKKLNESKLDNRFIDVLLSDKADEDKVKLIVDIQKEVVDKALKDAMPTHNPKGPTTKTPASEEKPKYNFQKFNK